MVKKLSMARWIAEARKKEIDLERFYSNKLEDSQRLRNSGLPCWDEIKLPYAFFNGNNGELSGFLKRYNQFIVKAIENPPGFRRASKRGVSSLEQCLNFLKTNIVPEDAEFYSVLLSEWSPTRYGGIIISGLDSAIIEITKELDELEHGQIIPATGFWDSRTMKYTTDDTDLRKLMWETFRYVRGLKGYFEFVITENSEIKFVDYKTNKGYSPE